MPNLISVTEAAKRLNCSRGHVYNLIAAGELARHDISLDPKRSKMRVLDEDLERYIKGSARPIAAAAV